MRNLIFSFCLLLSYSALHAQDGFYVGGSFSFLHAAEEMTSPDGQYHLTAAATFTSNEATFPQAFPNLGFGGYIGYKHLFLKNDSKFRPWAAFEFSYNNQNLDIRQEAGNLQFHTQVNHHFGPAIKIGVQHKRLSVFANVFSLVSQRFDHTNSLVPNGVLYDLDDAKENSGAAHPTYTNGVHTGVRAMGFGMEYFVKPNFALRAEYTATKHVEFRNENAAGDYFDSGFGVYQASFGVTYYLLSL